MAAFIRNEFLSFLGNLRVENCCVLVQFSNAIY